MRDKLIWLFIITAMLVLLALLASERPARAQDQGGCDYACGAWCQSLNAQYPDRAPFHVEWARPLGTTRCDCACCDAARTWLIQNTVPLRSPPTDTPSPVPTATRTRRPTATPRPTATKTKTPPSTPTKTATADYSDIVPLTWTPTRTHTPTPTETPTWTPTPTHTATPLPTATRTRKFVEEPETILPTATATATPSPSPTYTQEPPALTSTPTWTPRPSSTRTPVPPPAPTATQTPEKGIPATPTPVSTLRTPPETSDAAEPAQKWRPECIPPHAARPVALCETGSGSGWWLHYAGWGLVITGPYVPYAGSGEREYVHPVTGQLVTITWPAPGIVRIATAYADGKPYTLVAYRDQRWTHEEW